MARDASNISTDLYSGEPVVHNSGRVVDAIRASIAIPQLFPPQKLGDRLLVDGAVSNPLPQLAHPIGTFDSDQVPYIIEAGISATEEALPYIRRLLKEPAVTQGS